MENVCTTSTVKCVGARNRFGLLNRSCSFTPVLGGEEERFISQLVYYNYYFMQFLKKQLKVGLLCIQWIPESPIRITRPPILTLWIEVTLWKWQTKVWISLYRIKNRSLKWGMGVCSMGSIIVLGSSWKLVFFQRNLIQEPTKVLL